MSTIKTMRRSRPDPSLLELYQIDDKVLQEFVKSFKESISRGVRNNIPIEDDDMSWLLWKSLCVRYHKLKDLEMYKRKVQRLEEELDVGDEEAPVISSHFISCNYSVFSEEEIPTAIVQPQDNQTWGDKDIQAESKNHGSNTNKDKERLTVKEEDSPILPSYLNPHKPSILADHADAQGDMNKGAFESLFLADSESFRFENNDSHLASKIPITGKLDNNMFPEFECFVFNEETESNSSHCEIGGQFSGESCQFKDKICGDDKAGLQVKKVSHAETLVERGNVEFNPQPMVNSVEILNGTFFHKEEEDIICRFLSPLGQGDPSLSSSGINLKQIDCKKSLGDSLFYSLECESAKKNVAKSKDALEETKGQMFCTVDNAPILDRVGEKFHDRFDPMLDEFSLFDNAEHDAHDYRKECAIVDSGLETKEEVSEYYSFQFEMIPCWKNVMDKLFKDEECYDELWLFGKDCLASIFIYAFSLKFGIEEVTSRHWFGAAPMRHDLLLRKGSYFSQPVNGFT